MRFIVKGKRYDTENSQCIANNQNQNSTRWTTLYKTNKGNFFSVHFTNWQGELDRINVLDKEEAALLYQQLPYHEVEWEDAFPDIPLEEA